MAIDELSELSPSAVQAGADRSHGAADDLADFLVAEIVDVGEQHDLTLLRREFGERFRDRFAEVAVNVFLDGLDRERAAAAELLRLIRFRDLFLITSLATPKFVSIKVRDDPIDPG